MDHTIIQSFATMLNNLSSNIGITGSNIKLSLNELSNKIQEYSKASDTQAKRMYWLTWVLAGTGVLNVLIAIWQTYQH